MDNLTTTPQAMVMLPLALAYDVLLACDIAEIHIDIASEIFEEHPADYSEEEMEIAKRDFVKVKNLKEMFSKMFDDN